MMNSARLYDRIAGCLMAGALGDALGYEVEFMDWEAIERRFGREGITRPVPLNGKARFSDDTQMTLFTLEGMNLGYRRTDRKGIGAPVEFYIYHAYLCWLETQGIRPEGEKPLWEPVSRLLKLKEMNRRRAPGNTCLSALMSGKMGKLDMVLNHSKGCGGVMRTAPLGFERSWGDPITNGAKAAVITHGNPLGFIPAGMLSGIIEMILYSEEEKTLKQIIEEVLAKTEVTFREYEEIEYFSQLIKRAIELSEEDHDDVETIHSLGGGWVGEEALAIAIYSCLKYQDDIKKVLICGANHSGDSDSTAAIAGNIIGAWHGLKAIDRNWINDLELHDVIEKMAEETTAIIEREYSGKM